MKHTGTIVIVFSMIIAFGILNIFPYDRKAPYVLYELILTAMIAIPTFTALMLIRKFYHWLTFRKKRDEDYVDDFLE